MQSAMLVFLGGGCGSVLRWLTGLAAVRLFGSAFPIGTLAVNIIGCLIMGLLARSIVSPEAGAQDMRLLLMTGVLGGFTTFSAFALDASALWLRGEAGPTMIYLAASVIGSLGAVAVGLWLGGMMRLP